MDDFEHQLTVQVKEVLSKCREVTETRGQPIFVEKAKEAVSKTREFGNFLQRAQREELLPHAKVSVGQLIRVANNIGASTSEVEDSYKTVMTDIRAFCQAAKVAHLPLLCSSATWQTDGSTSPLSPRALGSSPLRTDSPLSARPKPPAMSKASPAQSTPDLFSHNYGRDAPSPRSPLAASASPAKKAAPPPPLDEDELAPAEDDDEDMILLKRKLAELKRQKAEIESEEKSPSRPVSSNMTRAPAVAAPPPPPPDDDGGEVETDEIRRELDPDICFTCGRRPKDGPYLLSAVDRRWHKACWQCYECKKPLVMGANFGTDGPRVYCEEDYKRKFFCAHCGDFIEDEAEEQGRKLYHLDCYVKFLDEKNKKDREKIENKQKQMAEDDEAYRKWIDEFEKITKRPTSVSPPPPVGTSSPSKPAAATPVLSTSASTRQMPVQKDTRQASHSQPELDPSHFPKVQANTAAGTGSNSNGSNTGGVAFGVSAADLLVQLGKPPSARDDPAGYKAYMRKRFALEEQLNKEMLAKQRFPKK